MLIRESSLLQIKDGNLRYHLRILQEQNICRKVRLKSYAGALQFQTGDFLQLKQPLEQIRCEDEDFLMTF